MNVETQHTAPQKTNRPAVLLLLGAAAYLYLNLFALPKTPFLLGGDQAYFWMDAQRLLNGERAYLDFLQYTPVGTDLFYLAFFKLFGFHVWVTNAAVLALGVALCWFCFSLACRIMDQRSALLASAFFLVLTYGKALNATNHWFSILAVMAAIAVYMHNPASRGTATAGALLGAASFFNQAHGAAALVAFVLFLLWRQSRTPRPSVAFLKDLSLLFLGFAVTLFLLSAHFIAQVGIRQLWDFQVTYVMRYAARLSQGEFLGLPEPLTWRTLPKLSQYLVIYTLLPVAYLVALWRCWREQKNPSFPWERVALLSIVGFLLFLEVAISLNWLRLYAVSAPGIILLIWLLGRAPSLRRYAVILLWIATISLATRQTISAHRTHTVHAQFPGGMIATNSQTCDKLHWIASRTKPGEFFLQAGWPGMYLPLQLRNPLYLSTVARLDATRPQDIDLTVQQLQSKPVQFILWTASLDSNCPLYQPCEDYLTPLRNYLHSTYVPTQVFPDGDALWQRSNTQTNASPSTSRAPYQSPPAPAAP